MKQSFFTFKNFAMVILLIPIGFLLTFGIGEVVSGMISGLQHFVQALPIVGLAYLAWKHPNFGGKVIVLFGLVLFLLYISILAASFPLWVRITNAFILFSPLILSGALFQKSTNQRTLR